MKYSEYLKFEKNDKQRERDINIIYTDDISKKYSLLGNEIRKLNDLDSFADYVEFCMKSKPIFDLFLVYGGICSGVKTYKDMSDGIMNHFITFVWRVLYMPLTNCFREERMKECIEHGIDGEIEIYI